MKNNVNYPLGNRLLIFIVIGLTLCGAFLRVYNLGEQNFISDELNHVYAAKSLVAQKGPLLPSGVPEDRAILYSYMVALSFKILGESEFSARIPSALFSIFLIPLIYIVSRNLLKDDMVSVCAMTLLAFDPWSIAMARFSRMYTMLAFLFVLLIYLFYKSIESFVSYPQRTLHEEIMTPATRSKRFKWGYFIPVVILFLVSYTIHAVAITFVAIAGLYLIFINTRNYLINAKGILSVSKQFSISIISLAVLLTLTVLIFHESIFNLFKFAFNYSDHISGLHSSGPLYYLIKLEKYISWHSWAFAFIGGIYMLFSKDVKSIFLASSFFIPLVMLSIPPLKNFRYIYHIFPIFIILISYTFVNLLWWLLSILRSERSKEKTTIISALVIVISLIWFVKGTMINGWHSFELSLKGKNIGVIDWPYFDGKSWEQIGNFLRSNVSDDDWIVSSYGLETLYYFGRVDFHIPEYGWNNVFSIRNGGNLRSGYDGSIVLENKSDLEAIMKEDKSIWIIVNLPLLNNNKYKYDNLKEFLDNNFNLRFETSEKKFRIYEWGKKT